MKNILEVKNLKKQYRNNRGVIDVSFELEKGDIFGLLGANGSGKTTTMKVITGLLKNYSGEINIFGDDVYHSERALYKVGSLIEMPAFYSYLTAFENLKIAANYYSHTITNQQIEEKLELVKLLKYKNERTSRFSLGMKQRLGLALAMISEPELFVLDEPANGLDIEGIVEIRNIILELAKNENVSFIISSHLSTEIQKTCNKVGIIHEGRLTSTATMDYILENYPSLEDYYLYVIQGGAQNAARA